MGNHSTRAYTQLRVFRLSLPVSPTNSQDQGGYKPCGVSSAALTEMGETGVPRLSCPAHAGPCEHSCLEMALLPSLSIRDQAEEGRAPSSPNLTKELKVDALTFIREVWEIGFHYPVVEGLCTSVTILNNIVVVIHNRVFYGHSLQTTESE